MAAIIPWFVLTAVALFGLDIMQGWRISEYDRDVSYYTETLIVESKISLYGSDLLTIGIYAALVSGLFLMGYLSLVRRVKGKTLWKNSLLRKRGSGICRDILGEPEIDVEGRDDGGRVWILALVARVCRMGTCGKSFLCDGVRPGGRYGGDALCG